MSTPPNPAEKQPEKSWQARIAGGGEATDAIAQSFVESISYDRRIYKQDVAGSIAHAAMLAKVGLITEDDRRQIEDGLRSIERDIEAGNFIFDEAMEDIHMVVEAELIRRIGEPGNARSIASCGVSQRSSPCPVVRGSRKAVPQ
jgi:argininosuccinate lyase